MSFVSEYNLGRDASTTSFLASLVCFLWAPVLRCLFRLPDRRERKHTVRIVGMNTGGAVAWLPIIAFPFPMCRAPVAKPLRSASRLVMEPILCYSSHTLMLSVLPHVCSIPGRGDTSDNVSLSRRK